MCRGHGQVYCLEYCINVFQCAVLFIIYVQLSLCVDPSPHSPFFSSHKILEFLMWY